MAKRYGFYSEKAILNGHGSCFYQNKSGGIVEVTFVSEDPEGESYRFPDKFFIGEVGEFLYPGHSAGSLVDITRLHAARVTQAARERFLRASRGSDIYISRRSAKHRIYRQKMHKKRVQLKISKRSSKHNFANKKKR